jgi:hypothetical protein
MRVSQAGGTAGGGQQVRLSLQEVYSNYTGSSCLPGENVRLVLTGTNENIEDRTAEFQTKVSHLSMAVTVLAIVAAYFTLQELK